VSVAIKMDFCGQVDEHQLKPEQIRRGPNDEYIVSFEGYTFVIPADKALRSNDHCSHIFFENVWMIAGGNAVRYPGDAGRHLLPHAAGLLTMRPRAFGYVKSSRGSESNFATAGVCPTSADVACNDRLTSRPVKMIGS
jgi:hypothetical protein